MDDLKHCHVTDLRRRAAAETLMKPCRPLLSNDLWQCCWTATLLATAEHHALNPVPNRAPLQCKAAACGAREDGEHQLLLGSAGSGYAVTGKVTRLPWVLTPATPRQRGAQSSPPATCMSAAAGQCSHLQLAGAAVVDHCDCMPGLPGTLLQQVGADAARPRLSPTLLPGHSRHTSPCQQRPAQAPEALPIRQPCVRPQHGHGTAGSSQAAKPAAPSTGTHNRATRLSSRNRSRHLQTLLRRGANEVVQAESISYFLQGRQLHPACNTARTYLR